MAITKEYTCFAHGVFESTEPVCPYGCSTAVERTFTQGSAGLSSGRTKGIDSTLQRLATRFGLSDMNNRDGKAVGGGSSNPAIWGQMPKGGVFNAAKGVAEGSTTGGAAAIAGQYGTTPQNGETNVLQMAKSFPKIQPSVAPQHRYGNDSELSKAVKSAA